MARWAASLPEPRTAPVASTRDPLYRGYRFPAEVIAHAVWLYYRFHLSHRDIEDLLAERGVQVSYEAIRLWCRKFGSACAAGLRCRRRPAAGTWHVDEVQRKIKGKKHWLWRAGDQDGLVLAILVLAILVQERRTQEAAARFLRRVLDGEDARPRVVVTDTLASSPPALKFVLPGVEHRRHTGLNTRAEHSHRPVGKRERVRQRFTSPAHVQRVLEPLGAVQHHCRPRRHLLSANQYRQIRADRFGQ